MNSTTTAPDTLDARRDQQRTILGDPLRFAKAMHEHVFYRQFGDLFMPHPMRAWDNQDEALAQVRLALTTPGADVERAIGLAGDIANNLATVSRFAVGLPMGVALEQIRRVLLATLEAIEAPDRSDEADADTLRKQRERIAHAAAPRDHPAQPGGDRDPADFAEDAITTVADCSYVGLRIADGIAKAEREEFDRVIAAIEASIPALTNLPAGHPYRRLQDTVLYLWTAAHRAGVREGAAAEHLRRELIAARAA